MTLKIISFFCSLYKFWIQLKRLYPLKEDFSPKFHLETLIRPKMKPLKNGKLFFSPFLFCFVGAEISMHHACHATTCNFLAQVYHKTYMFTYIFQPGLLEKQHWIWNNWDDRILLSYLSSGKDKKNNSLQTVDFGLIHHASQRSSTTFYWYICDSIKYGQKIKIKEIHICMTQYCPNWRSDFTSQCWWSPWDSPILYIKSQRKI